MPRKPARHPEHAEESLDDFLRRMRVPLPRLARVKPTDGYAQETEQALKRRRDECRRALNETQRFADLEILVSRLPPLQRERSVQDPTLRSAERARALSLVWLGLTVGISSVKGHSSDWPSDVNAAVAGLGEAIQRLHSVLARHPTFGLEHIPAVENLARAHTWLVTAFPSKRRAGRPAAEWRHQTIALLRAEGLTRADAEDLADTAGLIGGKSPTRGRRP
jgi:hypothetical protein